MFHICMDEINAFFSLVPILQTLPHHICMWTNGIVCKLLCKEQENCCDENGKH